jgi:hypothetical protein
MGTIPTDIESLSQLKMLDQRLHSGYHWHQKQEEALILENIL